MQAESLATTLALSRPKAVLAVVLGLSLAVSGLLWSTLHPAACVPLAFALAWAVMIDIDRYRLPDLLTLPMIAGGLLYVAFTQQGRLVDHVIGAAAGYFSLVLVASAYRRLRGREGLGRGDAKLMAAAGAWLGWSPLPAVLLFASVTGLAIAVALMLGRRLAAGGPAPSSPLLGSPPVGARQHWLSPAVLKSRFF
ncbi:MAG: A24 family peptidase [Hyphomonadaceae bacterium]